MSAATWVEAGAAAVTAAATITLIVISARTLKRSDAAIKAANESTQTIARSEWGARLILLEGPDVQTQSQAGPEGEPGHLVRWKLQNIGKAPAFIHQVRFDLPEKGPMTQGGGPIRVAGTAEVANQSHREYEIELPFQPRWLGLGGHIPDGSELRVYYTDDLGQQQLVWPQAVDLPPFVLIESEKRGRLRRLLRRD